MVAASTATALVACSGGQSKEDFIAAADDVCHEADQRVAAIGRLRSEEDIVDFVEQTKDVSADLVADLERLDPPEAAGGGFAKMIDGLDRTTELLEPLAQAAVDRDWDAFEELRQEIGEASDQVSDFAESYGFEVCGAKVFEPVR